MNDGGSTEFLSGDEELLVGEVLNKKLDDAAVVWKAGTIKTLINDVSVLVLDVDELAIDESDLRYTLRSRPVDLCRIVVTVASVLRHRTFDGIKDQEAVLVLASKFNLVMVDIDEILKVGL